MYLCGRASDTRADDSTPGRGPGSRSARTWGGFVMGYAKHIGRIGALAVALGIGTAVAGTPGVAWADTPGSSSDSSSTGSDDNGGAGSEGGSTPSDSSG